MPNTTSAKKMVRKIERRTEVNKSRRSRVRTFVGKVEDALEAKDAATAAEALKSAQPELHRAVSKGVIKKETASRKISRLAQRVKRLQAATPTA